MPINDNLPAILENPNLTVEQLARLFDEGLATTTVFRSLTPLHLVARAGNLACVRYLVEEKKADLEQHDGLRWTALTYAVSKGHTDVVRYLLDQGAGIDGMDYGGETALLLAVRLGRMEAVRLLLDRGVTEGPFPSICCAALQGHIAIIELLLSRGRDINATDPRGFNALDWAILKGHTETVSFLLDRGATFLAHHGDIEPPVLLAATEGHIKALRLLLDRGLPVLSIRNSDGMTALHMAAKGDKSETLDFLLDRGGNINARSYAGLTPLHAAIDGRSFISLRLLLSRKASLDAYGLHGLQGVKDLDAFTPLGFAGFLYAHASGAQRAEYEQVLCILFEHIDRCPNRKKLYLMPATNGVSSYNMANENISSLHPTSEILHTLQINVAKGFTNMLDVRLWLLGMKPLILIEPPNFEFASFILLLTQGLKIRILSKIDRALDWSVVVHRFLDLFPSSSLRPLESEQDAVYVEVFASVLCRLRKQLHELLATIRDNPQDAQSGTWRGAFRAGREVQRRMETLLAIAVGNAPPSADRKKGDASTGSSSTSGAPGQGSSRADLEARLKAMKDKLTTRGGRR